MLGGAVTPADVNASGFALLRILAVDGKGDAQRLNSSNSDAGVALLLYDPLTFMPRLNATVRLFPSTC